jgi:hypothetical protein
MGNESPNEKILTTKSFTKWITTKNIRFIVLSSTLREDCYLDMTPQKLEIAI